MGNDVRIEITKGYDEEAYCQEFGINTQEDAEEALANIHELWEQNQKEKGTVESSLVSLAESTVEKFRSGEFPLPAATNANGNTTGKIVGQPPASENSAEEANPPVMTETAEEESEGDSWIDSAQLGLEVAGMAPVVGIGADLLNAGISLLRGDYGAAAFSGFAAIPIAGDAAAAGKLGYRATKALEKKLASEAAVAAAASGTVAVGGAISVSGTRTRSTGQSASVDAGGISKGISTPAPGPGGRCQLKPYGDVDCGEGEDAHHVTPNRVFQLSTRKANLLMPNGVPEKDGLTICLESNKLGKGAEHSIAHEYFDEMEKVLKKDGITSDGLAMLEQIEDAAAEAIEKATGGMCRKEDIKEQLREYHRRKYGLDGKTVVRASKHPSGIRNVQDEMGKVFEGK